MIPHTWMARVLMAMQKYSSEFRKVSRRMETSAGLKAKDGTLADKIDQNSLVGERAWAKVLHWLLPVLFCEDNSCDWSSGRRGGPAGGP